MDDDQKPATKQDIEHLREELQAQIKQESALLRAEMKQDSDMLRSEFHHAYDDLKESIRDVQTELLKAFYNYSETAAARVTAAEDEAAAIKKRPGIVESRLTEVERRLNLPPQP